VKSAKPGAKKKEGISACALKHGRNEKAEQLEAGLYRRTSEAPPDVMRKEKSKLDDISRRVVE